MSEVLAVPSGGGLRQLLAFARSAEPRTRLTRRAVINDALFAALVMAAALASATMGYNHAFATAVVTSAPLVFRRRYPLTVFGLVVIAALAARTSATDVTFLIIIIAGYSAAMHSRFRAAAILTLAPAGVMVAFVYWRAQSELRPVGLPMEAVNLTRAPPGLAGLQNVSSGPLRVGGLLVLVSLVSIAIVGAVMYATDRIRRAQAEHEAATRRALRLERARIASELHDVVTHNVSVMIVQAGAARQVLGESPDQARQALLAVEASGRAAMTELRHLLGLLCPASGADGAQSTEDLQPQPGLGQLRPLVDRVTAAGLPVDLQVSGGLHDLPPGLDLAAFRVVQEALTNVIKHAGKAPAAVRLQLSDTELLVEVSDAGRPAAAGRLLPPGPAVPAGTGRGLLGLRERIALYGGELEAGPRLPGGWQVRARFPLEPLSAGQKLSGAGRLG